MLCAIYKSPRKAGMYLYIKKRDGFDVLPETLKEQFGKPIFVMLFNLAGQKELAQCNKENVRQAILEQGFYLSLPPQPENLFSAWVQANKKMKYRHN